METKLTEYYADIQAGIQELINAAPQNDKERREQFAEKSGYEPLRMGLRTKIQFFHVQTEAFELLVLPDILDSSRGIEARIKE